MCTWHFEDHDPKKKKINIEDSTFQELQRSMKMKEKIKVEYLTLNDKTYTFETYVTKDASEKQQDEEVITEIFDHAIQFWEWQPVKEHEE